MKTCSTRGVAITCEPLATVTYDAIAQYTQAVHVWDEGTRILKEYDHVQVYTEEGGGRGMMMMGCDHSTSRLPFPSLQKVPYLKLASGKLSKSFLRMHARPPATLLADRASKRSYYLPTLSTLSAVLLIVQIYLTAI